MFLVRQSKPQDVPTLVKLAKMVFFINLPPNEQILANKIDHSAKCIKRIAGVDDPDPRVDERMAHRRKNAEAAGWADADADSDLFMFSIEDADPSKGGRGIGSARSNATGGGNVIGTSQIRAHQGGPGNPNWTFKIIEKAFRSDTLGWGTTHKVGQLYGDETGPTEIGGLILLPSYRGHPGKPGRLISFVRFHWIGLYRKLFADRVIAEMMGPVTSDGDSIFWDHFGRKFIPVKYSEADRFCQHNRGFIRDLLPKDEIYLSLFPLEVQNQIGAVSRETIPARRMLEALGFRNRGFVDPFDAGPHLDSATDEISLVRETRRVDVGKPTTADRCNTTAIVSTLTEEGEFLATECRVESNGDAVRLLPEAMELLQLESRGEIGFTPIPSEPKPTAERDQPTRKPRRATGRSKVRA